MVGEPIAMTGMGMVTSLGLDVHNVCAAARAGIVNPTPLETYALPRPLGGDAECAVGHVVPMVTGGFQGEIRLTRLLDAALKDLQQQAPDSPWLERTTRCYLSLPDPHRLHRGEALVGDPEDREDFVAQAAEALREPIDSEMPQRLVANARHLSKWQGELQPAPGYALGHAGFAEVLQRACDDLRSGRVSMAVVAGVDSLVEDATLAWLERTGRLKTPDIGAALCPGEACACVLLETAESARKRGASILAWMASVHQGTEHQPLLAGEPSTGRGMAAVLDEAASSAQWRDAGSAWLVVDQNGEIYRAMEWGNAWVRLLASRPALDEPVLWYPAMSFGETGAASAPLGICMVVSAMARGYAPAPSAVIASSNEGSGRAAVVVRRVSTGQAGPN